MVIGVLWCKVFWMDVGYGSVSWCGILGCVIRLSVVFVLVGFLGRLLVGCVMKVFCVGFVRRLFILRRVVGLSCGVICFLGVDVVGVIGCVSVCCLNFVLFGCYCVL